ncbi:MAG TPA: alpha/beta fold hydrolase [Stellaceae bacterium]|nr:alpha/beta fold hydrolase [Stellaceae bacterium]
MRQRRVSVGLAALTLAASLASSEAATSDAAAAKLLPTSSCKLPGVDAPVRCGVLDVLENPNRPDGRRLPIHVAVIPATSGKALPDPIAVLLGGPGESAIGSAAYFVGWLGPLLKDHDLLLMDQRGTGQSAALNCTLFRPAAPAESLRDFFPPAAVASCKRRLEVVADLTRYTYPYFAKDLEQVRRALGYGPLNLFAGSYGTRAAQEYLREYPRNVRTAYLGSVVPIDLEGVLDFAKTAQTALQHMMENCEADSACHTAFPNLRTEFDQVLKRLASGKVRVTVPGYADPVSLGRGRVAEWFRSKLYRPRAAATLPWTIHRAYTGDWTPIVDGILADARGLGGELSLGLFFSITCSEDMPFVREQDVVSETQGTFLGDYRLRQQQAACRQWPQSNLPDDYRKPVRSDVPTLFVTGDLDGGTPLSFTPRVAEGFSNQISVVIQGQGHTEWNPCIASLYGELLRSASVRGLDAHSCPAIPLPPFKT